MNRRRFGLLVVCFLAVAGVPAMAADQPAPSDAAGPSAASQSAAPVMRIVYLSRENDPAYGEVPSEDGVFRLPVLEPFPGAELAIKDTRAPAHAAGIGFELQKQVVPEGAPLDVRSLPADAAAIIADLPEDDFVALAKAVPASSLAIFNIRHPADALRRDFCGTGVFHVIPSTSMLTDALAQFIIRRTWRRALVLYGPLPVDRLLADAFGNSAKKFGARVVDMKQFIYGNDPRKRDQIDIGIMTGADDYDVVFLADTGGDFGRYVPYSLTRPRPVIGTEGLRAAAWDAIAERFGAPQVNHRFTRLAHRDMSEGDWAAWVAVHAVVEAAIRKQARTAKAIEAALAHDELPLDVGKGIESSFRPWDHQLRQAIMLHSDDAVVDYAPIEGFLHQRTPLDTLGVDQAESACAPP